MTKIYVLESRLSPKLVLAPSNTKVSGKSVIMGRYKYALVAEYPNFAVYTHRPKEGIVDVSTVCDLPLSDFISAYPLVFVTHYTKDVDRNIKADVVNIISGNIEAEPFVPPPPEHVQEDEADDDDDIAVDEVEEEEDEEEEEEEEEGGSDSDEEGEEEDDEDEDVERRVYSTRKRRAADPDES